MKADWPEACAAHLRPVPLAEEGMALARFALQHHLEQRLGLMDVSDGLARDLPRVLQEPALLDRVRVAGGDIRVITPRPRTTR